VITDHLAGEVNGEQVHRYSLTNAVGMKVDILSYGGTVQSVEFRDRDGEPENIVLGFKTLEEYVRYNSGATPTSPKAVGAYFGALIGRYANRIAGGTFRLGKDQHVVPLNSRSNAIHGGYAGFDRKVWSPTVLQGEGIVGVRLNCVSPDGEMGFPGTLDAVATYTLDNENRLTLTLEATTDAATVVNLTNHTYWNLAGERAGTVYDQLLYINADYYTPVDDALIPTGEVLPVGMTPFDFRKPTAIGERIRDGHSQLLAGCGYDHNWVLNRVSPKRLVLAATAVDPKSGRGLNVHTTQPGLQFYTGNSLCGAVVGYGGRAYRQSDGFALETQHFPDAPNRPAFPSTELRPGEKYSETTVFELFCQG
jgi:aldose 1-epimerase